MNNSSKKSIIKPIIISIIAIIEVVVVLLLLALGLITGWTNTTRDTQLIDSFSDTVLITTRASYMEPTFSKNDVLIIDKYEYGDKVEVEDIVCFYRYYNNQLVLSTSRVESIETSPSLNTYHLKDDGLDGYSAMKITDRDIIGIYNGRKIAGIGGMVESLAASSTTFFCSIVLPMILVFISNGGYIAYHILTRKDDDEDEEDEEDNDEEEDNNTVDTENIVENEQN